MTTLAEQELVKAKNMVKTYEDVLERTKEDLGYRTDDLAQGKARVEYWEFIVEIERRAQA